MKEYLDVERMAAFGDHPPLPKDLGRSEDETTSTVFLKADCPPRAKDISELKLEDIGENRGLAKVSELSDQMLVWSNNIRRDLIVSWR